MMNTLKRLWNEDEAANAVEYALITGIIAVGLIVALVTFKDTLKNGFDNLSTKIGAKL